MQIDNIWMPIVAVLALIILLLIVRLMSLRKHLIDMRQIEATVFGLREKLAVAHVRTEGLPDLIAELDMSRVNLTAEVKARIEAETGLAALKTEHAARLEELRGMKKELEDRFAALASGVLQKNTESFLKLVSERFQSHEKTATEEMDKRKLAIENLVKPLDQKLGLFGETIKEIEKARSEAYGKITEQVKILSEGQSDLGTETRKLVQALRAPKTRGRWGEMQMKQVFDMAGMAEHVDYTLEHHIDTDDGARRPDAIVRIPGGKSIVVDAKTPLVAYLDAMEADTPEERQQNLVRHAGHVRQHIKMLSSKAYQDLIATTPDFVVMFIPGETFVSAAVEVDSNLFEYGFEKKVLIATPTTLMALVKAIAYGWQQEKMAENAAEVQRVAKELYDRLSTFGGLLDSVGKALNTSVSSYNKAIGSMERRVLPSARKFEAMGVVAAGTEIGTPRMAETETRRLSSLTPDKE